MYKDQEIEAFQLISLKDNQYEIGRQSHPIKQVAISSRQPELVCDVCTKTITKSLDHPTYLPDESTPVCCDIIWNQTICPEHLDDGTPICFGCMRLKTSDVTHIDLGDGREICLDCYSTAVFDIRRCEPLLIQKCHEFFQTLNMDLPNDVHVFLVDTKEMARLWDGQIPGMVFGLRFENTTITSVTSCSRKGNSVVVDEQESHGYRTGIAILFGFPKIMTQAILAHEMMHVYFRSRGIRSGELETKLEEGMCQVIGWKWLDWLENEIDSSSSSSTNTIHDEQTQFLRKLVETYKFVVETHNSYEYGQGFREVQREVKKRGLHPTIDHLVREKKLPEQ